MTQTATLSTDESTNLIAKYRDERKTLNRTMDKLIEAPWKKLSDEGLTTLAIRACMLQEGIPISRARTVVRDYENNTGNRGNHGQPD